jgi:hypothetical protein
MAAPEVPAKPVDQLIANLSELIAALAVPVSLGMLTGIARPAWTELHSQLVGFGWATAEEYEAAIRKVLDRG